MLRFFSGLAFAVAMLVPAHATEVADLSSRCSAQPMGTLQVDGAKATEEQMKAVRAEVEAFMNTAQDYISCVGLYSEGDSKPRSKVNRCRLTWKNYEIRPLLPEAVLASILKGFQDQSNFVVAHRA